VAAYRSFELHPKGAAETDGLLKLIPKDDTQQTVLMTLGDSLCDGESLSDMQILSEVRDGMPRALSNAVLISPGFLPSYVVYAEVAVQDPHSDYAAQMRRVCRHAHGEFSKAVDQLPPGTHDWFKGRVMEPRACTVLDVPEADE
jgi:hypothetical protein